MSNIRWRFPIRDGGTVQGFNNSGIATFKGSGLYDNLAREICQNSLDAKAPGKKSVIVEFQLDELDKNTYGAISAFDNIIASCETYWEKRCDKKMQVFFNEAREYLKKTKIPILVIRDYNTTGLTGARNTEDEKSVWMALTHSDGVTEKKLGSAGSFGIGKNAPFACSSFRTVFYNTCAIDEVRAFKGVAKLVTHIVDGKDTQGTGYFQNVDTSSAIFDEPDVLYERFKRKPTEYGTDVIILGYKIEGKWQESIERAVIKNFFTALYEENLIVKIGDLEINKANLQSRIEHYAKKDDSEMQLVKEFYLALTEPDDDCVISTTILEPDDLQLYIKKNDKFSKRIMQMRAIGMCICDRGKGILTKFSAVMIARGEKLNEILKNIEPPQHNEWDPGIIEDDDIAKREAEQIRSKIIKWTNSTIVEKCKSELSEEIDPVGISAFLPFDEDDTGMADESRDDDSSLSSVNIIKKTRTKKVQMKQIVATGKKTKGTENDGNSFGAVEDVPSLPLPPIPPVPPVPPPIPPVPPTPPVPPPHKDPPAEPPGEENTAGNRNVVSGTNGAKTTQPPKFSKLPRILPVSAEAGIYKILIQLDEDRDNTFLSLKALGDDENREDLMIIKYTIDSKSKEVNSAIAGPFSLKAGIRYEIFLTLELKERMAIELFVR